MIAETTIEDDIADAGVISRALLASDDGQLHEGFQYNLVKCIVYGKELDEVASQARAALSALHKMRSITEKEQAQLLHKLQAELTVWLTEGEYMDKLEEEILIHSEPMMEVNDDGIDY